MHLDMIDFSKTRMCQYDNVNVHFTDQYGIGRSTLMRITDERLKAQLPKTCKKVQAKHVLWQPGVQHIADRGFTFGRSVLTVVCVHPKTKVEFTLFKEYHPNDYGGYEPPVGKMFRLLIGNHHKAVWED